MQVPSALPFFLPLAHGKQYDLPESGCVYPNGQLLHELTACPSSRNCPDAHRVQVAFGGELYLPAVHVGHVTDVAHVGHVPQLLHVGHVAHVGHVRHVAHSKTAKTRDATIIQTGNSETTLN